MQASFHNLTRIIVGIALFWSFILLLMHGKLLKQHKEEEKRAAELLAGKRLQIVCGKHATILRDRQCIKRFKWVVVNWVENKCYGELGVTPLQDIDCSVYQYLVLVERVCPVPLNAEQLFAASLLSEHDAKAHLPIVTPPENFSLLYKKLKECGKVCQWIEKRIRSSEEAWMKHRTLYLERNLSEATVSKTDEILKNYAYTENDNKSNNLLQENSKLFRRKLRILLHMGLLTKQYGLNFGEAALVGGPLGELVQWSDLMASLSLLGHDVVLSWSPQSLRKVVVSEIDENESCHPARVVDLIFTDLVGLDQLREALGSLHHYRCLIRILDVYGTDPVYNHPVYNPEKSNPRTWGGRGFNPSQFFTHFPHSPDNSFLGFVVEKYEANLTNNKKRNAALLYGKRTTIVEGKGKRKYLDKIYQHFEEIHATMWEKETEEIDHVIPPYVINHKNMDQTDFLRLLRQSAIYVGLEQPTEGPAALEAVANGAVFLNPKFIPNRFVAVGKPTNRKLTSQNPYAEEHIGEPMVYTFDIRNVTEVEEVLNKVEKQSPPKPFVPFEFTREGFLERINVYIEKQDFCSEPIRNQVRSKVIWKKDNSKWPPVEILEVKFSELGESCSAACNRHKMVCERNLFSELNNEIAFLKNGQECLKMLEVSPHEEYIKYKSESSFSNFQAPCYAPSYNSLTKECSVQTDELLISCACKPPSGVFRICPCRKFKKEQLSLFS